MAFLPNNNDLRIIIIIGAAFGSNIRRWGSTDKKADLGQCFVAIDPKRFAPGFETRLSEIMDNIRKMEPVSTLKIKTVSNTAIKHCRVLLDRPKKTCNDSRRPGKKSHETR